MQELKPSSLWCSHCLRPAVNWGWRERPCPGSSSPGPLAYARAVHGEFTMSHSRHRPSGRVDGLRAGHLKLNSTQLLSIRLKFNSISTQFHSAFFSTQIQFNFNSFQFKSGHSIQRTFNSLSTHFHSAFVRSHSFPLSFFLAKSTFSFKSQLFCF